MALNCHFLDFYRIDPDEIILHLVRQSILHRYIDGDLPFEQLNMTIQIFSKKWTFEVVCLPNFLYHSYHVNGN